MGHDSLSPHVKHSLAKYVEKGEDAWAQQPDVDFALPESTGPAKAVVFGVFDGHGGKQAASFASRHLISRLQAAVSAPSAADSPVDTSAAQHREKAVHDISEASALQAKLLDVNVGEPDLAECRVEDALAAALPAALVSGFAATEQDFNRHSQESGTTATVAVVAGWELLVANVGDSLAYLDTGSEVIQVSGNHRLDDSKAERERITQAGAEVAQSEVDGKPVGPLRVWPGGLAMGRTIGDASAGQAATCEPEIRQLTLPHTGARLLIASDGLWDLVNPKTAAHHIRGLPASKAAADLVQLAQKNRMPRDDITVLVIDVIPPDTDAKIPPLLNRAKKGAGAPAQAREQSDEVDIFWPLTGEGSAHWRRDAWQRRLTVAEARHQLAQQQQARQAAAAAAAASAAAASASAANGHADSTASTDAAFDAASGASSDEEGSVQYASELHRQMANLVVDPTELEAAEANDDGVSDHQEGDGWETVEARPGKHEADPFRKMAVPGYSAARQQPQDARNHGGRGRGRDGRGRDGGRGRSQGRGAAGRGNGAHSADASAAAAAQLDLDMQQNGTAFEVAASTDTAAASAVNGSDDNTVLPVAAATALHDHTVPSSGRGRHSRAPAGRGRSQRQAEDGAGDRGRGRQHRQQEATGRGRGRQDWQQDAGGRGRGRNNWQQEAAGRGRGRSGLDLQPRGRGRQGPHGAAAQQLQQQQQQPLQETVAMTPEQLFQAMRGGQQQNGGNGGDSSSASATDAAAAASVAPHGALAAQQGPPQQQPPPQAHQNHQPQQSPVHENHHQPQQQYPMHQICQPQQYHQQQNNVGHLQFGSMPPPSEMFAPPPAPPAPPAIQFGTYISDVTSKALQNGHSQPQLPVQGSAGQVPNGPVPNGNAPPEQRRSFRAPQIGAGGERGFGRGGRGRGRSKGRFGGRSASRTQPPLYVPVDQRQS